MEGMSAVARGSSEQGDLAVASTEPEAQQGEASSGRDGGGAGPQQEVSGSPVWIPSGPGETDGGGALAGRQALGSPVWLRGSVGQGSAMGRTFTRQPTSLQAVSGFLRVLALALPWLCCTPLCPWCIVSQRDILAICASTICKYL